MRKQSKKVVQAKYKRFKLRPGLDLALISAGRDDNIGAPRVPSGMMLRVDLPTLLGVKVTSKVITKLGVAAFAFAFDKKEVLKLAKQMTKAVSR